MFSLVSLDLDTVWSSDKEMRRKVEQALYTFGTFEEKTKKLIQDVLVLGKI